MRVTGWEASVPETIAFDEYIAFEVEWGRWDPWVDEYCYWLTGYPRSILEVRVVRETGLVRTITLVHADQVVEESAGGQVMGSVPGAGAPKVNVAEWADESPVRSPAALEVRLSADTIRVTWSAEAPASVVSSGGRVRLGLTRDQHLVSVEVVGITVEEMRLARVALGLEA